MVSARASGKRRGRGPERNRASAGVRPARGARHGHAAPYPVSAHGRPGTHPQLLDHRPHRPRQVDAGRSHPRDDEDRRPAFDARAGARLDGSRARARHHDQGPGGARALRGARRRDLPAASHRHARTRRLHLRGQPLARRLRGRAARRRRLAGRRGADRRQHVPRDRERPRAHPGAQQARPSGRRARARRRGGRRPARRADRRHPADLRQDRRRGHRRARAARRARPAARRATATRRRAR